MKLSLTIKYVNSRSLFAIWNNESVVQQVTTFVSSKVSLKDTQITHCLQKKSVSGKIMVSIVDGDDMAKITKMKEAMVDEFEIEDLGNVKYFLGMEVGRSKERISISQWKYTLDLLKETSMTGCKTTETPTEFNAQLGDSIDKVSVDKERYQRLVGKLINLPHTRPDISYATTVSLCRYPTKNVWKLWIRF